MDPIQLPKLVTSFAANGMKPPIIMKLYNATTGLESDYYVFEGSAYKDIVKKLTY